MQTSQAIFSALLLSIIAAAGLVKGIDAAWIFAGITAALAFFSIELARHGFARASAGMVLASNALTILSWATGAFAGIALLV